MNKHLKPGVAVALEGLGGNDKRLFIEKCQIQGAGVYVDHADGAEVIAWTYAGYIAHLTSQNGYDLISINQALGRESEVESNELPAVGSHLEVSWGNKSMWHECVVLPSNRLAIDRYAGWHVVGWQDDYEFRPLKTEKAKFVERLVLIINDNTTASFTEISGVLYDKGLRFPE